MQPRVLRVVTFNCLFHGHARARLRAIGGLLRKSAPGVACLQEIFLRRNVRLLGAGAATFQPWGPGVAGGLVTLTDATVESWSFEPFRTGLWFEWAARKGFLTTRLQLAGEAVTVVNTHLLANYDNDWAIDNRYARRQLDELSQLADAVGRLPRSELVVVAGDFNVPAQSPQFSEFMAACGLRAALDWNRFPAGGRGYLAIDNVLYRPAAGQPVIAEAALRYEDPIELGGGRSAFPSDHVAVEAQLQW